MPMDLHSGHRVGEGEPLVLIHGAGASWHDFKPMLSLLGDERDLVALRTAGAYEGMPLEPGADLTLDGFVDRLEADLDRLGLHKPDLVGDSTGGLLALELARRGRARTVVAMSPSGMWTPGEARDLERDLRRMWRMARFATPFARLLTRTAGGRYLVFSPSLGTRALKLDPEDAAHAIRALASGRMTLEMLDANRAPTGTLRPVEGAGEIDCPVMIVWGEQDRLLPVAQAERWVQALPDAELHRLAGVGHHPQFDEPEAVVRLILDFLARRAAGEPAREPTVTG